MWSIADVNECATSQCDSASTDCINTSGGFYCRCRTGFAPNLDCRPIGDLGLISGGIPDEAITVSGSEAGFTKEVRFINYFHVGVTIIPVLIYICIVRLFDWVACEDGAVRIQSLVPIGSCSIWKRQQLFEDSVHRVSSEEPISLHSLLP